MYVGIIVISESNKMISVGDIMTNSNSTENKVLHNSIKLLLIYKLVLYCNVLITEI